jgi:hypothetical protein
MIPKRHFLSLNELEARVRRRNADDPKTFEIARSWLQNCIRKHPKCAEQLDSILPSRLLEMGVRKDFVRLGLSEQGSRGQYVALSYCWVTAQQFTAAPTTLRSLLNWFPTSKLPKTIQDAIRVTQELGIKYLWVESLCILQGADAVAREDWERESPMMHRIYSDSILTIVVASSRSSDEGIFRKRKCPLPLFEKPNEPQSSSYLGVYGTDFQTFFAEPINDRAWTLQERLLSNRALVYCHYQMIWECKQRHQFEELLLKPDADWAPLYKLPAYPQQMDWREIIWVYSRRKLTVATDKLPAFSALAKEYARR